MSAPVVVTAYYPVPSKHPTGLYAQWIHQFWSATQCRLVFFTDPGLVAMTETMLRGRPGPFQVVPLAWRDLTAFRAFPHEMWGAQKGVDPEAAIHSPELYAIWFEKKEFVRRAAELCADSDLFIWADAGICRYPAWIYLLASQFAISPAQIPRGRMLQLQMEPFRAEDSVAAADGICGDMTGRICLGGGVLASDRAGWKAWGDAYDEMLRKYIVAGRFFGKDQNIMASVALHRPDLVTRVSAPAEFSVGGVPPGLARWFYLLFYLAGLCS